MLGICRAIGDIDMTTAAAFNADLHDTIDGSDESRVSVDCSDLTFIGPAGYHALVDATDYAARRNRTLVIRNMSPACATMMRLYDWDHELHFER
jgi:anti-anti-sigma factor